MGCKCGSQIILCNLPVRFDTYRGCSHGCRYCFAQKKNDISHIERDESVDGLRSFIEGKRGNETEWCDWNIPIHWGGMSDPFQPVEKQIRASYECLKLLAETKYPFVVSTKGRLIAEPEYLDLLAQCNCVLQISMVCSKYDRLERGTPSYEERLAILKTVSARVQRTIVRIQPYMPEVFHDVMKNIPRIAEAGAYGVIVEGMKFFKAKPGMTKIGGSRTSRHLYGIAADWRTVDRSVNPVALGIIAAAQGFGAVGIYWHDKAAIVHTDTRGGKATWLCVQPGVYPSTTYNKFVLPTIEQGCTGAANRAATVMLQRLLGITHDGSFGPATTKALMEAQHKRGLAADGICGPKSWTVLSGADKYL